jgi:hypothetical protein
MQLLVDRIKIAITIVADIMPGGSMATQTRSERLDKTVIEYWGRYHDLPDLSDMTDGQLDELIDAVEIEHPELGRALKQHQASLA